MAQQHSKNWWQRNIQKADGSVDTSGVMKLAVMVFVVCFMICAAMIFAKIGWQFFFTNAKKLLLSPDAMKTLAFAVGGVITLVGIDHRIKRGNGG